MVLSMVGTWPVDWFASPYVLSLPEPPSPVPHLPTTPWILSILFTDVSQFLAQGPSNKFTGGINGLFLHYSVCSKRQSLNTLTE